jgi:phage terminase small subunit
MAMNTKRKRFAQEYVVDLNGTAAAERAGYRSTRAKQTACDLLADPDVQAYVQELREAQAKRCEITADMVLAEYAKLAFLDPRRFFDDYGNLLPVHQLSADVAAALAGMDVAMERVGFDDEGKPILGQIRKIKFSDKKGALDSVARCLGMFKDKMEVTVNDSLAERIQRAKERAGAAD